MILISGKREFQTNRDCTFFKMIFLTKLEDYLRFSKGRFFTNRIFLFTEGCTGNTDDFLKLFCSRIFYLSC